ncbi:flagellin N-terminal helical domain-containing protein, partial [Inconstantimicrobium porci]
MIINHNMNALNAHRNMTANNTQAGKAMEKLSSGLRINRAGDDAAGLAISEKMRAQINGLDQASRNSQDGISLIQTAEGALNETHSILQRMRTLAVQSSSDTNVATDRQAIQAEMDQLNEEINRISKTTEFNTQKLLDGSFDGKFQIGANETQNMGLSIGSMSANSLGLTGGITVVKDLDISAAAGKMADGEYTLKGTNIIDSKGNAVAKVDGGAIKDLADAVVVDATGLEKVSLKEGASITVKAGKMTVNNTKADSTLATGTYKFSGKNVIKDGELIGELDNATITAATKIKTNDGKEVTFDALGLTAAKLVDGDTFTIHGSNVSTRKAAEGTITTVNNAIEKVSTERAKLGAVQNRLEHTINNL